jgi:hypothetical protein
MFDAIQNTFKTNFPSELGMEWNFFDKLYLKKFSKYNFERYKYFHFLSGIG